MEQQHEEQTIKTVLAEMVDSTRWQTDIRRTVIDYVAKCDTLRDGRFFYDIFPRILGLSGLPRSEQNITEIKAALHELFDKKVLYKVEQEQFWRTCLGITLETQNTLRSLLGLSAKIIVEGKIQLLPISTNHTNVIVI